MQYKRNVIEGTLHRVFRSISTWENFDQALEKNRKQWSENQYPKNWLDMVVFETLNMIIEEKKNFDKWLKIHPTFHNAISRQSISTVSCKVPAIIRGTNNFYNKKIENMFAISQNFLCSLTEFQIGV